MTMVRRFTLIDASRVAFHTRNPATAAAMSTPNHKWYGVTKSMR